jgi:hypothetical protein
VPQAVDYLDHLLCKWEGLGGGRKKRKRERERERNYKERFS